LDLINKREANWLSIQQMDLSTNTIDQLHRITERPLEDYFRNLFPSEIVKDYPELCTCDQKVKTRMYSLLCLMAPFCTRYLGETKRMINMRNGQGEAEIGPSVQYISDPFRIVNGQRVKTTEKRIWHDISEIKTGDRARLVNLEQNTSLREWLREQNLDHQHLYGTVGAARVITANFDHAKDCSAIRPRELTKELCEEQDLCQLFYFDNTAINCGYPMHIPIQCIDKIIEDRRASSIHAKQLLVRVVQYAETHKFLNFLQSQVTDRCPFLWHPLVDDHKSVDYETALPFILPVCENFLTWEGHKVIERRQLLRNMHGEDGIPEHAVIMLVNGEEGPALPPAHTTNNNPTLLQQLSERAQSPTHMLVDSGSTPNIIGSASINRQLANRRLRLHQQEVDDLMEARIRRLGPMSPEPPDVSEWRNDWLRRDNERRGKGKGKMEPSSMALSQSGYAAYEIEAIMRGRDSMKGKGKGKGVWGKSHLPEPVLRYAGTGTWQERAERNYWWPEDRDTLDGGPPTNHGNWARYMRLEMHGNADLGPDGQSTTADGQSLGHETSSVSSSSTAPTERIWMINGEELPAGPAHPEDLPPLEEPDDMDTADWNDNSLSVNCCVCQRVVWANSTWMCDTCSGWYCRHCQSYILVTADSLCRSCEEGRINADIVAHNQQRRETAANAAESRIPSDSQQQAVDAPEEEITHDYSHDYGSTPPHPHGPELEHLTWQIPPNPEMWQGPLPVYGPELPPSITVPPPLTHMPPSPRIPAPAPPTAAQAPASPTPSTPESQRNTFADYITAAVNMLHFQSRGGSTTGIPLVRPPESWSTHPVHPPSIYPTPTAQPGAELQPESATPFVNDNTGRPLNVRMHEAVSGIQQQVMMNAQSMAAYQRAALEPIQGPPLMPNTVGGTWVPPWQYVPTHMPQMPALFQHPVYNRTPFVIMEQPPMRHPIFHDYNLPTTFHPERHVGDIVNRFHVQGPLRDGVLVETIGIPAYDPQAHEADVNYVRPIGVNVDNTFEGRSTSHRYILRAVDSIHSQQQATMARKARDKELKRRHDCKGKGKSKGKGKGFVNGEEYYFVASSEDQPKPPTPIRYTGTDTTCSICASQFKQGEMVTRVACQHLFHEDCWNLHMQHHMNTNTRLEMKCPNCRGPGEVLSVYRELRNLENIGRPHVPQEQPTMGEQQAPRSPQRSNSVNSMSSAFSHSGQVERPAWFPHQIYMINGVEEPPRFTREQIRIWEDSWSPLTLTDFWEEQRRGTGPRGRALAAGAAQVANSTVAIAQGREYQETFITDTNTVADNHAHILQTREHLVNTMRDDMSTILLDIGANVNAVGRRTLETMKTRIPAEFEVAERDRASELRLSGVGQGTVSCTRTVKMPMAVRWLNEEKASKCNFQANIAEGAGENLPAIMGNASMEEKNVILLLGKGKQTMIFPGPGGYKLECSTGSKKLPIMKSQTKHLVVKIDDFKDLPPDQSYERTFLIDHSTEQWEIVNEPEVSPPPGLEHNGSMAHGDVTSSEAAPSQP